MQKKLIICFIVLLMIAICTGCGKSKDPLIGTWDDGDERVTFNSDGTFSAYSYWYDGEWNHFEDKQDWIEMICPRLDREIYKYTIDGDSLHMVRMYYSYETNQYEESSTILDFTRYEKDKKSKLNTDTSQIAEESKEVEEPEVKIAEKKLEKDEDQTIQEEPEKDVPNESNDTTNIDNTDQSNNHSFGYINRKPDEYDKIVGELEATLKNGLIEDFVVECIVDDFDGDGELEGIAVTTPEFNKEWVESGVYDELTPATLWGYEKSNGEYTWLSKPFYEDNDNEFVRMQEARIKPGIIVLQVDYFKSAHDVRSDIYTFGEEENTACLGTFDNAFINEDGQIVSDHSGYEYDPTEKTLKSVDIIIKPQTE